MILRFLRLSKNIYVNNDRVLRLYPEYKLWVDFAFYSDTVSSRTEILLHQYIDTKQ
jgi:hypothetical protein